MMFLTAAMVGILADPLPFMLAEARLFLFCEESTMNQKLFVRDFWSDVAAQKTIALNAYCTSSASILWNNTNEQFAVVDYIVANCQYTGDLRSEIECIEQIGDVVVSVTKIWLADNHASFHATSFSEFYAEN
ncbi:MAG: nuclear transport factor 2 family protein [Clostridia bacterium]